MISDHLTFPGKDGVEIFVHRHLPEGKDRPRANFLIAHGMAEHGARYTRLAGELIAAGFGVYAIDHRGHGKSIPEGVEPGHMGDRDCWAMAIADLATLALNIHDIHPMTRLFLLGHSMGSFMAQQFLWSHGDLIAGAALSATNGPPSPAIRAARLIARFERLRLGRRGKSALIDHLSFSAFNKPFQPSRTDFDWLSRDEAEVDKYIDDPLCGFRITTQSWVDFLDALPILAHPEKLRHIDRDKPILLQSGTRDPVGEMGKGPGRLLDAYRAAGLRNVELKLYEGARHEIYNETNRDEVTADLIAWADKVLG